MQMKPGWSFGTAGDGSPKLCPGKDSAGIDLHQPWAGRPPHISQVWEDGGSQRRAEGRQQPHESRTARPASRCGQMWAHPNSQRSVQAHPCSESSNSSVQMCAIISLHSISQNISIQLLCAENVTPVTMSRPWVEEECPKQLETLQPC